MIQAFLGPIANLAGTWLQGKMDKSKAETEMYLGEKHITKIILD